MSIVKYKNQSGQVYAYEQTSYWDSEKRQSRSKRTLLGRVDPVTGKIVPTEKRRGRPKKSVQAASEAGTSDDYKTLYETVLAQLEDAKQTIGQLRQEKDTLTEEYIKYRELISMIHERTSLL